MTELDLLYRSQGDDPQFYCVVAIGEGNGVIGYAVMTLTPFTYDLIPTATLKELFVDTSVRGTKVGSKLFDSILDECLVRGISRLNWTVMRGNVDAERFYQKRGGQRSEKWILYELAIQPKT